MVNNVMLMGRLTVQPEIKTTGESRYVKFALAVARPKKMSETVAETDFFNCIAWNRNADVISKWYNKDDLLMIGGNLRNNKYEKNGENRIATQVIVREIHFTGGKKKTESAETDTSNLDFSYDPEEFEEIFADEDVPF